MPEWNERADFDQYAGHYDDSINRALLLSGEKRDYFALKRIEWLAGCVNRRSFPSPVVMDFGCGTGTAAAHVGYRSSGFEIYSKIRPGFIHFTQDPFAAPFSSTDFAVDIGGVFEFFPSRGSVVRVDVSDTAIHFGPEAVFPIPFGPAAIGTFWSHNLQFSAGVGVRF